MTLSDDKRAEINPAEAYQISLLEEKLQVARRKKKVGEVIVRKQVETRIVKLPIRRETLIVERVGKNPEQLAEVVIGTEKVCGFEYEELDQTDSLHLAQSSFLELSTAQELLQAISQVSADNNLKIRIEIVNNNSEHQTEYQNICDRFKS